jgi:hypothetical protein
VEMAFLQNLVIIREGDNSEQSNNLGLIQPEIEAASAGPSQGFGAARQPRAWARRG